MFLLSDTFFVKINQAHGYATTADDFAAPSGNVTDLLFQKTTAGQDFFV